jgi:predicted transposase YbfD/YdcC
VNSGAAAIVSRDKGFIDVSRHQWERDCTAQACDRFPRLATIAMVESRIERGDKMETERRSYISSRALSAAAFAEAARGHWGIENNLHWTLDVTFNEDQSRLRTGHGAQEHGCGPPLRPSAPCLAHRSKPLRHHTIA